MRSDEKKDMQDIGYLIDEYETSPGLKLYSFVRDSKYMTTIHQKNYAELIKKIDQFDKRMSTKQKNTEFVKVQLTRQQSRKHIADFLRLLHNYVSSAYTIEENYREFLSGRRYGKAYDEEIGVEAMSILDHPQRLFFFALRNHFTHFRPPEVSVSIPHKKSDLHSEVFIIETRGRFTISKSFFRSDFRNVLWEESSPGRSKLLTSKERLAILERYISLNTGRGLSIEIRDVLILFEREFEDHFSHINNLLIAKQEEEYNHTKQLIDKISQLQHRL